MFREWVSSSTLRLRFEAPTIAPRQISAARSATFLIAGSPFRSPQFQVRSCHFYRVRADRVVGESYELPYANEARTQPLQILRFTDLGQFRHYHVYALHLNVATVAPARVAGISELWVLDYAEVDVDLGPPVTMNLSDLERAREFARTTPQFVAEEAMLLNPDLDASYFQTTTSQNWSAIRDWGKVLDTYAKQRHAFRLGFYQPGVFRVTPEEIVRQRGGEEVLPPERWRALERGQTVPLYLPQNGPARRAAYVIVGPWDVESEGMRSLWLFTGADDEEVSSPARITLRESQTNDDVNATASVPLQLEIVAQRYEDYQARIRPNADVTKWFWKTIADGQIEHFPIVLPTSYEPQGGVSVTVFYALSNTRQRLPHIEFIANGESVTSSPLATQQGSVAFQVPAHFLRPSTNTLALKVRYVDDSLEEKREVLVQKFVFRWSQPSSSLKDMNLPFRFAYPAAGRELVAAFADKGDNIRLVRLDGGNYWVSRPNSRGEFQVPAEHSAGLFTLVDLDQIPSVPNLTLVGPKARELLTPVTGCDYLAIAHSSLAEAVRGLLDRRAAQGLHTRLVCVEDIFDVFGFGYRTAESIHSFLTYAYFEWPSPRLAYTLLVGEASDFNADPSLMPPKCQMNMVPTNGSARSENPRGDHPYACVAGADQVADLAVGRLSVATPDELSTAIEKIAAYEDAAVDQWVLRAMMVTDDNEEFPTVASEVIERTAAPPAIFEHFRESAYPYVPNVRVYGKQRSWEATRELIRRFDEGRLLVIYWGHGGPNLWSHERLFHLADLRQLRPTSHIPFVACASCDNAWLDYPIPPVHFSMGELLVKQPNGGAIGVFAPVSGATPYEHQTLMTRLVEGLLRRNVRRLGEATLYAKNQYYGQTFAASIPQQYVLVGDPAVKLKLPKDDGQLVLDPPQVAADRPVAVSVSASSLPEETSSSLTLYVYAIEDRDLGLTRPVEVIRSNVRAELTFESLREGTYCVLLPYFARDGLHYRAARFDAIRPEVALNEETVTITSAIGTTDSLPMRIEFFNPTQQSLSSILCEQRFLNAPLQKGLLGLRDCFSLPAGASRRYEFEWTPACPNLMKLAWRGLNPLLEERVVHVMLPRKSDAMGSVALCLSRDLQPTSSQPPTDVESLSLAAEIWNIGSDSCEGAVAVLEQNGKPIGNQVPIPRLGPGERRSIALSSRDPLPAGETTVTLVVSVPDPASTATNGWRRLFVYSQPVKILRGPDLEFVPESVYVENATSGIIARTTVMIHAAIRNNGDVPIRNVPIQVYVGDPKSGSPGLMLNGERTMRIPEIPPYETVPFLARWEDCSKPGTARVWLVANRQRNLRERNYDNNTLEVPPFTVRPLGDFRIAGLTVTPTVCESGTTVSFTVLVSNDADIARGPLDIEYGFDNPLTGAKARERYVLPSIGPMTTETVRVSLPLTAGMTRAYAIVNASRELEEADAGGNDAYVYLTPVVDLVESTDARTQCKADLSRYFALSDARNCELLEPGVLRLTDAFTSTSGLLPASPSWYRAGNVVGPPIRDEQDSDGKWTLAPWRIDAFPNENAGALSLSIPVGPVGNDILADVYVHSRCAQVYKNVRLGRFAIAVEGAEPQIVDFKLEQQPNAPQRFYVGRYSVGDDMLDVTLNTTTGSAVSIVGFEIAPAAGTATSPAMRLPAHWKKSLLRYEAIAADPGQVKLEYRCGEDRAGSIVWSDWVAVPPRGIELPCQGRLLQWRVTMKPGALVQPILRKVELECK